LEDVDGGRVSAQHIRHRQRRLLLAALALLAAGITVLASEAGNAPGQPLAHPLFASLSASPSSAGPGQTVDMMLTIGASVSDPGIKVREVDIDYSGDSAFHAGSTSGFISANPDDNGSTWSWTGLDVHLINPSGPPTTSMSFSFSAPSTPGSYSYSATVIADGAGDGSADTSITVVGASLPTVSIADASVTESNSGTTTASFPVVLSTPAVGTVSVVYATADGSATAGSDYVTTSGTVTFVNGESSKTVNVTVNGDTVHEGDETFLVNLSDPSSATIGDGTAVGRIIDDDGTGPDVALTKQASAAQVTVGDTVTFTILAQNVGDEEATGVAVSDPLPGGLQLVSASASTGSCSGATCTIGALDPGTSATVTVVARATQAGLKTNTASATTSTVDPNPGNNSASATIDANDATSESESVPPPGPGQVNIEPAGRGTGQCIQTVSSSGCVPLAEETQFSISEIVFVNPGTGAIGLQSIEGKGIFYGTPFNLRELNAPSSGAAVERPVLRLQLAGGNFSACKTGTKAADARSTSLSIKKKKPPRRLFGNGKGRFRTKGRYSAGTVRGTYWVTIDRCDGTLTHVYRGVVSVHDLVLKTYVRVHAGQSYLASPAKKKKK
jgi:uncharacterized repeat protein (TIGR01451 family)